MKRLKGFLLGIVCAVVLSLGLVFTGCGNNYSGIEIALSTNEVNLKIGYGDDSVLEADVSATISGVKKDGISKVLEFVSSSGEVVRVDGTSYANDVTSAKLVAVGGGDAFIFVISEGNVAKQISVHVEQEAASMNVDVNYTPVILVGSENGFVFDVNKVSFNPTSCTNTDLTIELWKDSGLVAEKVFADAKVVSSSQIAGLVPSSNTLKYYFKIFKTSTIGSSHEVSATVGVDVKQALDVSKISLYNLANGQGLTNIELSTDNLGDSSLKPSIVSVGVKYDGDVALSGLEVRASVNSLNSFAVSDVRQRAAGGEKYFDITALGSGSGKIVFSVLYYGYEVSRVEKSVDVFVVSYPKTISVVSNGIKINLTKSNGVYVGEFNLYNGEQNNNQQNKVSFYASPIDDGVSAKLKLEFSDADFASLVKDSGTSDRISGILFTKNVSNVWISEEFASGKEFAFVLANGVVGGSSIQFNAYISSAVLDVRNDEVLELFSNKQIAKTTLTATASVSISSLALKNETVDVSTNGSEHTKVLLTYNETSSSWAKKFNVEVLPEGANIQDLRFSCDNASVYFNVFERTLTVVTNSVSDVVAIKAEAPFMKEVIFYIQFYVAIGTPTLNFEEMELSGNAVYENEVIYLSKSNADKIVIPVAFENNFAYECASLASFSNSGINVEFVNSCIVITSNSLANFDGELGLTFVNKFNSLDTKTFNVRLTIYDKISYNTVKFFEESEGQNAIKQISLDYFKSVGVYGNSSKVFYLGKTDGLTTYSFDMVGGTKTSYDELQTLAGTSFQYEQKIETAYGALYVNGRCAMFVADRFANNGSDDNFGIIEVVGTEKQFATTYLVRMNIIVTNKTTTNKVTITNVENSIYTKTQIENMQLEWVASPTNADNKDVVFVVTDKNDFVLGSTLLGDLNLKATDYNENEYLVLKITSSGVLSVYVAGEYKIYAVAKDSILSNILVGSKLTNVRVDSFSLLFADGTEENPFLISNYANLISLANFVYFGNGSANNGEGYYFKLTDDIDCGGNPVSLGKLNGTIDGNNKRIYNFVGSLNGLFDEINGTVKNLTISNAEFVFAETYEPVENAGILAGLINGTVNNLTIINVSVDFSQANVTSFGAVAGSAVLNSNSNVNISNLTVVGSATNTAGIFAEVSASESASGSIKISGSYVGTLTPIISGSGMLDPENFKHSEGYVDVQISIDQTDAIEGCNDNLILYVDDVNAEFAVADLFSVTSTAKDINNPTIVFERIPYTLSTSGDALEFDAIAGKYKIKHFGAYTFTATSDVDDSVFSSITIYFLPNIEIESNDIFMANTASAAVLFNVGNNINYLTDEFTFEVEDVSEKIKYDKTTNMIQFKSQNSGEGGNFKIVCYYNFADNSKLYLAGKTVIVTMDTKATNIDAKISKTQLTPADTAILEITVDTLEENESLHAENFNFPTEVNQAELFGNIGFKLIYKSELENGKISFKYLVYVDSSNLNYGDIKFSINPNSNGNISASFSVNVVRARILDIDINHFKNDSAEGEISNAGILLNGKVIDNEFININDESVFSFYMSPEVIDVVSTTISSNQISFEVVSLDGGSINYVATKDSSGFGAVKVTRNEFDNGCMYVKGLTSADVAANSEVWVQIEVEYKISNTETTKFSKRLNLIAISKTDLQIVAPTKVASLCDFDIRFTLNGNILYGADLIKAANNLSFGTNFNIVSINDEEGTVTLQSAGNVFGTVEISTSFEQEFSNVTRIFDTSTTIEVVDVLIETVKFVSDFGTNYEKEIDNNYLTITAYNTFNVGIRFVGQWHSSFNSFVASLEGKLNSKAYRFNILNGYDEYGNETPLIEGGTFNYLQILETEGENAALQILPIRPTSSTGIDAVVNYAYDNNGRLIIEVNGTRYDINFAGSNYTGSLLSIKQKLTISVDANSSEDCPIPISTIAELIANNKVGSKLILINDIKIEDWTPIAAVFDYLDGNGYSLILAENAFQNYLADLTEQGKIVNGTLNIGIFSAVAEGTIIKNLNIKLSAKNKASALSNTPSALNLKFSYIPTDTSAIIINFGTLAAQNSGIITNCHLIYSDEAQLDPTVATDDIVYLFQMTREGFDDKSVTGNISTFVGFNEGTITQSSTNVDLSIGTSSKNTVGDYNVGGFVAINKGVISSCYSSNASVSCKSENHSKNANSYSIGGLDDAKSLVSGFVAYNSGTITYSYIFGGNDPSTWGNNADATTFIVSNYKTVQSNMHASAFVMTNTGKITNSYANIKVTATAGHTAGFAFDNASGALIQSCYALSLLYEGMGTKDTAYGFTQSNQGTLSNCYVLYRNNIQLPDEKGLTKLTTAQMTSKSSYVGFGFQTEYNTEDADWSFEKEIVYVEDREGTTIVYATLVGTGGSYVSKNGHISYVGAGKGDYEVSQYESAGSISYLATGQSIALPRIVNADTKTSSRRKLVGAVDENGRFVNVNEIASISVKYHYYEYVKGEDDGEEFFDIGTKNNPILITTVNDFKRLLINGATTYSKFGNDYYYRMLTDLDFDEELTPPEISTSTFYGFLDGGGMTIKNLRINVGANNSEQENDANEALGLFGIIDGTAGVKILAGRSRTTAGAGVKGLTVNLKELYANTYVYVGGLAGVVNNAYIYNVQVNQNTSSGVISYGRNIIGGAIGLATGRSEIYALTADVSVFSTYSGKEVDWSEVNDGDFQRLQVKSNNYVHKTQFIGGVSYFTDAKTSYAGGVIGVMDLIGDTVSQALISRPTTNNHIVKATRVGGIIGYVGEETVVQDARIDLANVTTITISGSDFTGGLFGENHGTVKDCSIINQKVSASNEVTTAVISSMFNSASGRFLGGVVGVNIDGTIENCNAVDIDEYNENSSLLVVKIKKVKSPYVSTDIGYYFGGVVGFNRNGKIKNCYNVADLESSLSNSFVGGIVGYCYDDVKEQDDQTVISSCYNIGKITLVNAFGESQSAYAGGIVGKVLDKNNSNNQVSRPKLTITNSFNVGKIESNFASLFIGGFVGQSGSNIEIRDSFVSCNLVNSFEKTIEEDGEVSRYSAGAVGYFVDNKNMSIYNSYIIANAKGFASATEGQFNFIENHGNTTTVSVSGSYYTVDPYQTSEKNLNQNISTPSKTFVELSRILASNASAGSTWLVNNGWAPVNNFDDIEKFRSAIKYSESPFTIKQVAGDNTVKEITENTTRFEGNTTYVLTRDVALNSEIDASGWTGTLIGNGYTITLKAGRSMFQSQQEKAAFGTGATLFNFNIALENASASNYANKTNDFGALVATVYNVKNLNIYDVNLNYSSVVSIVANQNDISVGGFIGSVTESAEEDSIVNFIGCVNSMTISVAADKTNVNLGGFVGRKDAGSSIEFSSCLNAGTISAKITATTYNETAYVASFVGYVGEATRGTSAGSLKFDQCIVAGNLEAEANHKGAFYLASEGNTIVINCIVAIGGYGEMPDNSMTSSYQMLHDGTGLYQIYFNDSHVKKGVTTWSDISEYVKDNNSWSLFEQYGIEIPLVMFSDLYVLASYLENCNSHINEILPKPISSEEDLYKIESNKFYYLTTNIESGTLTIDRLVDGQNRGTFNGSLFGNGYVITLRGGNNFLFGDGALGTGTIQNLTIAGGGLVKNLSVNRAKLAISNLTLVETKRAMIDYVTADGANISISNSVVKGNIVGKIVAGFISYVYDARETKITLDSCINFATITTVDGTSESKGYACGFIGEVYFSGNYVLIDISITNCLSAGKLIGDAQTAFLADFLFARAKYINNEAKGSIKIENSYAANIISGAQNSETEANYWDLFRYDSVGYTLNDDVSDAQNNYHIYNLFNPLTKYLSEFQGSPHSIPQGLHYVDNTISNVIGYFGGWLGHIAQEGIDATWENGKNSLPFPKGVFEEDEEKSAFDNLINFVAGTDSVFAKKVTFVSSSDVSSSDTLSNVFGDGVYVLISDIALGSSIANEFNGTFIGGGQQITLSDAAYLFADNKLKSGARIFGLTIAGGGLASTVSNANFLVKDVKLTKSGATLFGGASGDGQITLDNVVLLNPSLNSSNVNYGGYFAPNSSIENVNLIVKNYNYNNTIPDYAFYNCQNITALEASCATIGTYAFGYCRNLESITFGSGLTTIEGGAFAGCSKLKEVVLPNSTTTISWDAFYQCGSLKHTGNASDGFVIPESVTNIGDRAFYNCQNIIALETSCATIGAEAFCHCSNLETVTLKEGVTSVGKYAFAGTALTSIHIPASLTSINPSEGYPGQVFESIPELSYITVHTDNDVFKSEGNCLLSKNGKTLYVGCVNSVIPDGVTTIDLAAFLGRTGLKQIVTTDSGNLSAGILKIPDVVTIGNYAFASCSGLTSVTIPDSLTSIGAHAFEYCGELTTVTISDNSNLTLIGDAAFSNCQELEHTGNANNGFVIPSSVTHISSSAFNNCYGLKKITIPRSVTDIDQWAFADCHHLEEIYYNAANLNDLKIYDTYSDGTLKEQSSNIFRKAGLYSATGGVVLHIGSTVERIPRALAYGTEWRDNAEDFDHIPRITNIDFSNATFLEEIGGHAFQRCSYISELDMSGAINLTTIDTAAFGFCSRLENNADVGISSVSIPANVTTIDAYAFEYCTSLQSITIPSGVTSIEPGTFEGCSNLTGINIPANVGNIEYNAFKDCSTLASVTFDGNNVWWIGFSAFAGCAKLTSITIPSGVTYIGASAFYYCTSLQSITIPSGVTSIEPGTFEGCANLVYIILPSTLTEIGAAAFSNCQKLKHTGNENNGFIIPYSVTHIYGSAFNNCYGLKKITIPRSVTTIDQWAFADCHYLEEIYYNAANLNDLKIYDTYSDGTLKEQSSNIFRKAGLYSASGGVVLHIGSTVERIPRALAYGTEFRDGGEDFQIPRITNIDFSNATFLEEIGGHAFQRCSYISELDMSGAINLTTIDTAAFGFCSRLENDADVGITSVIIPASVKTIIHYAFEYCYTINFVTFKNPNGWEYGHIASNEYVKDADLDGATINVSSSAATLLKTTYFDKIWKRDDANVLIFTLSNGMYSVKYPETTYGEGITVEIPSTYDSKTVYKIEEDAFKNHTEIANIIIPQSIRSVGENAFYNCSIEDTTFHRSENGYYLGCDGDPFVVFVKPVDTESSSLQLALGTYVIYAQSCKNYGNLTYLQIPYTVEELGKEAFYGCTKLSTIEYDAARVADLDSNSNVFYDAGRNSSSGITLTIGTNHNYCRIPNYLFYVDSQGYRPRIRSISGTAYVTRIGDMAFYGLSNLTGTLTIDFGRSYYGDNNYIGYQAFYNTNISEVMLTNSSNYNVSIRDEAFYNCRNLGILNIGDNIQTIGNRAFGECRNLQNIVFGADVRSISGNAFENCNRLNSIYINSQFLVSYMDSGSMSSIMNISPSFIYILASLSTPSSARDYLSSRGYFLQNGTYANYKVWR